MPTFRRLPGEPEDSQLTGDETTYERTVTYATDGYGATPPQPYTLIEDTYYVRAYHGAPVPPETTREWALDSGYEPDPETPGCYCNEDGDGPFDETDLTDFMTGAYESAGYFYGIENQTAIHTYDETGECADSEYHHIEPPSYFAPTLYTPALHAEVDRLARHDWSEVYSTPDPTETETEETPNV